MPEEALQGLRQGLADLNICVKAILTHPGEEHIINGIFPKTEHCVWYSYRFNHTWQAPLDINLYNEVIGPFKSTALPLVERYNPFEGGSIEAETRTAHEFSVACYLIDKHSPDIILFGKTPEAGIEYMLYRLARHFLIPVFFTERGVFGRSRTVSTRIATPLLDKNWNASETVIPICNLDNPGKEFHRDTVAEIEKIRKLDTSYAPDYMRNIITNNLSGSLKRSAIKDIIRPQKILSFFSGQFVSPVYKFLLYRNYIKRALQMSDIDWGDLNIFFPLHYQPELTTMPLGGEFVNQIKAIKLISDALPPEGRIIVKDHLSTFSNITKTNPNFRPQNYYNWIKNIPKAQLVSPHIPSVELQLKCQATATITGTAGLEAILRNKPVLVFGHAPYLNAPGTFRVCDTGSIKAALDCIEKTYINNKDVDAFLMALEGICWHGGKMPTKRAERSKEIQKLYAVSLLNALKVHFA